MKHTAQSGRTMVETLGALAVMGVLSVGGLHAFSSIMDRFRANDLLEGASARAMRVSEQIKKGRKTLSLGKFLHNETSGGTFSKQVFTEGLTKQFGIQVSNVKKAVCERLLDSITDTSPLRRLALSETPRNPLTQCQDLNSFLMIYNGGFKGESQDTEYQCETNSQCPSGQNCQDGFCACPNNGKYVYTATGRPNGKKTCCDPELVVGDVCCNSVEYDEFTGEKLCCGFNSASVGCCPEGYFAYNKKCYSCDDPNAIYVVLEEYCSICPQRSQAGHRCVLECPEADQINQNNRCYCPDDKPVRTTDGKCHSCDSGKTGVWYNNSTLLLKNSGWSSNVMEVCAPAGYCGNYYSRGDGYILPCSEGRIGVFWAWTKGNFKLKDGTQTGHGNTSTLKCYDCSEVDISSIKMESQCNICRGTWNGETWYDTSGNSCTPPDEGLCSGIECGENECIVCNPENGACENMCQSVEYLESTGTQYIDTGMLSTANSTVNVVFGLESAASGNSNNGAIFGGRNAQTSGTFTFFRIASSTPQYFRFDYNAQKSVATANNFSVDTASKYVFNYNGSTATATNTTEGKGMSITVSPGSTFSNYPIALFAVNTAGSIGTYFKGRIYSYNYSDGSNSIDFIPVIAPDGRAAMFDQVSKKLFYNKGTGSFKTNLDE